MSPNNTGFHRFPFNNFMRLFNSLFKVLFIFPSRYLFAIGLLPIFSFRWNLPPASGCTPKQPDSTRAHRTIPRRRMTGFSPSPIPRSKGFWRRGGPMAPLQTTIQEAAREWPPDFRRELCPLHSPLLGASRLFSSPPLSDMLKFSGWPHVTPWRHTTSSHSETGNESTKLGTLSSKDRKHATARFR